MNNNFDISVGKKIYVAWKYKGVSSFYRATITEINKKDEYFKTDLITNNEFENSIYGIKQYFSNKNIIWFINKDQASEASKLL